jgi:hypothetical protein
MVAAVPIPLLPVLHVVLLTRLYLTLSWNALQPQLLDAMFAELRRLPRCAEKLRSLLSLTDAYDMVLRFVCDDIWGGAKVCRVAARSIADYLVHAWNHRNACKHSGAVLPPPSAPVGRGADGDVAMA